MLCTLHLLHLLYMFLVYAVYAAYNMENACVSEGYTTNCQKKSEPLPEKSQAKTVEKVYKKNEEFENKT